jgi:hypothetical protein
MAMGLAENAFGVTGDSRDGLDQSGCCERGLVLRGRGRRVAMVGAVCASFGMGGAAAAQASFPAAPEGEPLMSWLRRETDITPAQVVAISPSAITAVISTYPTGDPPGMRVVVRAEALSAMAQGRDGVLSWHVSVATDCSNRKVRMGETTGYAGRNLIGNGHMIRPLETEWRTALPGTPLDAIWRLACDRSFRRPLAPETASVAMAGPAGAMKTAPREVQAPEGRPPPAAKPPVEAKPPAVRAAPPPKAPSPPPREGVMRAALVQGGVAVQITAAGSDAGARQALAGLSAKLGGAMAGRSTRVEPAQVAGRTFYRALVTGFGSAADAGRFCETLKGRGQACFVRAGG